MSKHPGIAGVYNVTGGNESLAQALAESHPSRRLLIAHEVNEVTMPLLRAGIIDFLITQRAESLMHKTRQVLLELRTGKSPSRELNHVPFEVVTEFNLDMET